ncbi:astacin [Teladorsagia circumcincta]|uniref:Metalloendopeptidase n=1 Tax=Teladorsagia circumcincta TaxID=45464 RepID=A0A2G9UGE0_TELCI|nr:astacin [Teladorsagia circumcincta]
MEGFEAVMRVSHAIVSAHDLLVVLKERGCWSDVGRQGDFQFMSLGESCDKSYKEFLLHGSVVMRYEFDLCEWQQIGIVAHEIGHALGFWHTHSRYDRDRFITVLEENINVTYIEEFLKLSKELNNNYGLTYDYGSVMHYGATAASIDKNFTMVPKDVMYTGTLGSPFIAFYDLLMMNIYYNCTGIRHYQ